MILDTLEAIEEEKEEVYKELANVFIRMAQKERRETNEKIQME